MENTQALQTFIKKEANDLSVAFVAETMAYMRKDKKEETTAQFCQELCRAINEMPTLRYLQIALVRSKALTAEPFYRLSAYGVEFYLSEPLYETELSLDWLYEAYDRFREGLKRESRKYVDQIGSMTLERIMLAELYNCQKVMKFLFAETLPLLIRTPEFEALEGESKVQFHLSESMGPYKVLLTKDKNMMQMKEILDELLQTEAGQ